MLKSPLHKNLLPKSSEEVLETMTWSLHRKQVRGRGGVCPVGKARGSRSCPAHGLGFYQLEFCRGAKVGPGNLHTSLADVLGSGGGGAEDG